ncbi:MAG: alcohol dehydrogenase catalytic domain-containing protein [Planctomycetes bacterium]|nr:alcohol dehydrogenase catalytic domain-containing protein [Planctomycetota bacterium]
MRAAFRKGATVILKDIPSRPLAPDQIRVRVEACGICGTDLHNNPDEADKEQPFGHEIAGVIDEVGSAVLGLEPGRNVVLESSSACGRCDACRNTSQELCTDVQSFFIIGSLAFAEEMIAPAISAIPFDDLSPDVACLSEPLGVAIDIVRLADIRPTSNVLLIGAGPIGLMALSLARRMGARRVFVSEFSRAKARVDAALDLGADCTFDPSETPLDKVGFGCAIDRVLVTAPPPTLKDAFSVASKGAIISFIGIGYGENAFCRFDANEFHFKKLQLRASFASPALCTPLALQYLREGVVNGPALISHRFKLDQMADAMATARDSSVALKVIVEP